MYTPRQITESKIDILLNRMKVSKLQRWRVTRLLNIVNDIDCRIYCFGSSVKGNCRPSSDLDLVVELKETDIEQFYKISKHLREVYFDKDLVNNEMDIIFLNTLDPDSFIYEAVMNAVLLKDFT